jgi:hypothetical protein
VVAVLRGKLPLWRQNLEAVFGFLEEFRITSGAGLVKLGEFGALAGAASVHANVGGMAVLPGSFGAEASGPCYSVTPVIPQIKCGSGVVVVVVDEMLVIPILPVGCGGVDSECE